MSEQATKSCASEAESAQNKLEVDRANNSKMHCRCLDFDFGELRSSTCSVVADDHGHVGDTALSGGFARLHRPADDGDSKWVVK